MEAETEARVINVIYILSILGILVSVVYSFITESTWLSDNIICVIILVILMKYKKAFNTNIFAALVISIMLVIHNFGPFGAYTWHFYGFRYDRYLHLYGGFALAVFIFRTVVQKEFINDLFKEKFKTFLLIMLLTVGVGAFHEVVEYTGGKMLGNGEGVFMFGDGDGGVEDPYIDLMNDLIGGIIGAILMIQLMPKKSLFDIKKRKAKKQEPQKIISKNNRIVLKGKN
ncbi:hypothetical protein ACFL0W_05090 [Nanoarchaeota archaeon]